MLRRITKHVNEQNWFAVGLDLMVVVVGIFLGLQVADWSQYRSDRQREHEYLERLRVDFSKSSLTLRQMIETYDMLQERQSHVLLILKKDVGQITEDDLDFIADNLRVWSFWRQVDLELGTINELISSGEMKLIRDKDIRRHLFAFHAGNETIRSQLSYFRDWFLATKSQFMYEGIEFSAHAASLRKQKVHTNTVEGLQQAMTSTKSRVVDIVALKSARSVAGLTELHGPRRIMMTILEEQAVRCEETFDLLIKATSGRSLRKGVHAQYHPRSRGEMQDRQRS